VDYIGLVLMAAPGAVGCVLGQIAVRRLAIRSLAGLPGIDAGARGRIVAVLERVELPARVVGLRLLLTYGVLIGVLVSAVLLSAPMWIIGASYGIAIPPVLIVRFLVAKRFYVQAFTKEGQ